MRPSSLVAAVVVALLAFSAVARADDREEARREFSAGLEADKRKDWTGALDHYLRANDLVEHPFAIYNIATDYERLGNLREAGVWYRRYLDKATDPNDLAKVRAQLADLELRPGPLTIQSVPGGARAFVDNVAVGVTPLTVPVKGGSHRVAIEHEGRRIERDVRIEYAEPKSVSISLGAAQGTLMIAGQPVGATIYVDGKPAGTLPSAMITADEGPHDIRVVAIGYAPFTATQNVTAGAIASVPVTLERGGSNEGTGSKGSLIGYYIGVGGGADATGLGATARTEVGLSGGHYDFGVSASKIGSDTLVDLLLRYTFIPGRFSPFLGASLVLPSSGVGVFGGLKLEVVRAETLSIALLAQGGIYRYAPGSDSSGGGGGSGSDSSMSAVTALPITISIVAVFGRRVPQPASAPAATPGAQ